MIYVRRNEFFSEIRPQACQGLPLHSYRIFHFSNVWDRAIVAFTLTDVEWLSLSMIAEIAGLNNLTPCYQVSHLVSYPCQSFSQEFYASKKQPLLRLWETRGIGCPLFMSWLFCASLMLIIRAKCIWEFVVYNDEWDLSQIVSLVDYCTLHVYGLPTNN